ncbi:meprin A subunit beta-like [Conger conger]|uniref:meprin A subunit beta-like n=1 Tax=Conger conger TaxID=82655 RepID=UPI002A5A97E3|nr:meprin A subunit beta-like [Conger conger]XP_061097368.1 meprin A subunit beta-like [Conger conger]
MDFFIFLFVGFTIKLSQSMPTQGDIVKDLGPDFVIGPDLSIEEINQGLNPNLTGGDIMQKRKRSAVLETEARWEIPVPYTLNSSLDINAKAVVLRSIEEYALKSCIDFKLRDTERNYISIEKDSGCYSYVGNIRSGRQILSIGQYCDHVFIVEHEFLHALGFFHEQSRFDRDEYVTIVWENIEKGFENNFEKILKNESTTQGSLYDYNSIMHYAQFAFSNGNGTTIITKQPKFQNLIGQRFSLSRYDAEELNNLYNCTSSVALLEKCTFENESTCRMSQCSKTNASWSNETFTSGGPRSGHTNLGVSEGPTSTPSNESSTSAPNNMTGTDIFMHFSTVNGVEGDRAKMETGKMTPRRRCSIQCLQFYYYHSGNESDQLNIWIRQFDQDNNKETLSLMWRITGPPADYWQLQHVPLNANKLFQVEFEGQKGEGRSSGGFSIDDINLSETECPHQTWHIRNVEQLIANDTVLFSPRYFSKTGYGYQILAVLSPTVIGAFVRLVSGENDDQLQWPCPWHQITILFLDQNPDIQKRMSRQFSYTTDPTSTDAPIWDEPRKVGTLFNDSNGDSYYVNRAFGVQLRSLEEFRNGGFMKGGDIFILVDMQDISELRSGPSRECSTVLPPQNIASADADDGPCVPFVRETTTTSKTSSLQVSSFVVAVLMAWAMLWSY